MPSSDATHRPSIAELIQKGALYPIPIPRGWNLIDAEGKPEPIPTVDDAPFHRLLALGALMAADPTKGEMMVLRPFGLPAPPSESILDQYTEQLLAWLTKKEKAPRLVSRQISTCAVSRHPCAKLVVERNGATDTSTEIHYLIHGEADISWKLVYLLHRDSLASWAPLLAELDGPRATSH